MTQQTFRFAFVLLAAALVTAVPATSDADQDTYAAWIQDMKEAERGPFERLRWFCNDGSVLPPRAYACSDRGGGHQHGEWSDRTRELRANGYYIATLLAGADGNEWLAQDDFRDRYGQLAVERFLIGADDGWILRRALFYRGAIQEEDEREGARNLLLAMADDPYWVGPGFAAWRTGAKLLPHGQDSASIDRVRQLSASLSDRDPGFRRLRAKIHGSPDAGDAARVRDYASGLSDPDRAAAYRQLADEIDAVYAREPLATRLAAFLRRDPPAAIAQPVDEARRRLLEADSAMDRLETSAVLLARLRGAIPQVNDAAWRLAALDMGFDVETEFFAAATELRQALPRTSRAGHVAAIDAAATAAHGTGLINARLYGELRKTLAGLEKPEIRLDEYRGALAYMSHVPAWGTQALRMYFFDSMETLAQLEPLAMRFIQDQLRASPLLLYADLLNVLARDAGEAAGVRHRIFGEDAGAVFTALNPGMARGTLHLAPDVSEVETFRPDGIYVLPETVSDLPPVRGILTAGEGNPLSHVQLLARNLGIPNATISESALPLLAPHDGERVVLAVSPAGLVEIAADGPRWDSVLGPEGTADDTAMIRPDLEKLDLSVTSFVPLDDLRASDSGRIVGPKAAKLGELRRHYPGKVGNGVAIPFGIFKQVALEQPHPDGGTVFDWMVRSYETLGPVDPMDAAQAARYEAFRKELYDLIVNVPLDATFRNELEASLKRTFGDGPLPGLFVRSDTNVEDLAGFTGAGLNLTLPNVVGLDHLLDSIRRVWASPFTARAFGWRQSHMADPEHVYTSILLLRSTASDKSGVLVTQDIDTGDRGVLSVAVNEGLGGAVDGQAAESLRIDTRTGQVRVLATATAPTRSVPDPAGGLRHPPASGSETVLQPDEIRQLIEFARSLPERFPPIVDDEGNPAPADVEFGFVDGDLRLFQLRPFLGSHATRGLDYLARMDAGLADTRSVKLDMTRPPLG